VRKDCQNSADLIRMNRRASGEERLSKFCSFDQDQMKRRDQVRKDCQSSAHLMRMKRRELGEERLSKFK
jgi:hypothetical protein